MANVFTNRYRIAEVARRLLALRDESIAPAGAVRILIAEAVLPAQSRADPALPFTSAINSLVGPAAGPSPLAGVVDYVGACETQGHGDAALRLLARLKISRRQGRMSLSTIGVEVLLLVLVLAIHGIFVLPQFKAVFAAAGAPLPAFTRVVLALIGPTGPFLYLAIFVLLAVLAWRILPALLGPLLRPIDRLLLSLPLLGPVLRERNSDRISGWLGFATADAASQRAAVEAARTWFSGGLLSRECAEVLRFANTGQELTASLAQARGFDSEFHAVVALPERADALAALRARWRTAEALPEHQSQFAPLLARVVMGLIVGAVVVAMYLPVFRLASVVG